MSTPDAPTPGTNTTSFIASACSWQSYAGWRNVSGDVRPVRVELRVGEEWMVVCMGGNRATKAFPRWFGNRRASGTERFREEEGLVLVARAGVFIPNGNG